MLTTDDTDTAPTVEDALSQASLLVNGGGLAQLQTVTEELNTIVGGREDKVRSLLEGSTSFLTEANATTDDIDLALRSLASVAKTLRARQQVINRAVREIRPAARVLRQNTPGLTRLLQEVEKFSAVANKTVSLTRTQLLNLIRQAQPVLAEFTRNRGEYAVSLRSLVSLGNDRRRDRPRRLLVDLAGAAPRQHRVPRPRETLGSSLGVDLPLPSWSGQPDLPHLSVGRASRASRAFKAC